MVVSVFTENSFIWGAVIRKESEILAMDINYSN